MAGIGSSNVADWYRVIEFPLAFDQYDQLPRNEDYKYEYWDGEIHLTPRPKVFHALLSLEPREALSRVDVQGEVAIRNLEEGDWAQVARLFGPCFSRTQPFASLGTDERNRAGQALIRHVQRGGEGPVIRGACQVAEVLEPTPKITAALLVTLYPRDNEGDDWHASRWKEPAPPDAVEMRLGRPHLTWIFVAPMLTGQGVGSALLAHAVNALHLLGFEDLASSFSIGNARSALWHWRNGFRLLEYPGSLRAVRRWLDETGPD